MSRPDTGAAAPALSEARTLWELVDERARLSAEQPMLIDEADRRVSFGEFRNWAERVAAGFWGLGIRPGTRVSWQLPTRIETVVASMALSRLGAVQNPIIPIYREREVGFVLRQSQAEHFLVPGQWKGYDFEAMATKLAPGLDAPLAITVTYDQLPEGDIGVLPAPPDPSTDPVRWLYYTSGTTSDPKGVRHTDQTLIAGAIALAIALDITPADVGSIAFPYTHIGGPDYLGILLLHGFPAVLLESFVPAEAAAIYRRHGVTMAGGTTAFYTAFINEQRKDPDHKLIPSLRVLSGGGAPKPPEVFFEAKRELGVPIVHGWAMTECPMLCYGTSTDTDEQLAYTDGAPVHGAEVKVVDANGHRVPPGTDGELRVRGTMLFKGYVDPGLNRDVFDDEGYFVTGDLGHVRADGHAVVTGRSKDIIIRKGENISAKEVEDLLYTHPAVAAVAVIGLPDRDRGELVCAVIETVAGNGTLTAEDVRAFCREAGLSSQKIPERVEIVEHLPLNATLKVLKYQLRERFSPT